jgi:hypothetical protein
MNNFITGKYLQQNILIFNQLAIPEKKLSEILKIFFEVQKKIINIFFSDI